MSRSQFLTHLLKQIDLVALIQERYSLKECGSRWQGWHSVHESESKESLKVWDDNGIQKYFCFNCQQGGTAIDYVMREDGLSCRHAIAFLCDRAGVADQALDPEEQEQWVAQQEEKRLLESVLTSATNYYHQQLTPERREYLYQRGLTDETIERFKLGYADGSLYEEFKDGQYSQEQLLLSGLFRRFENASIRDCFLHRYVFPYTHCGKVVYMIARRDPALDLSQLPEWNRAKYLKLSLYDQKKRPYISRQVQNSAFYGEDSIHRQNKVIITEGVIDCLLALQAGFACMSPASVVFREGDWQRLSSLVKPCKTVYLINDNEESGAGEKGALKTAEHLFQQGSDARLVVLPRGRNAAKVDLADFLNQPSRDGGQPIDALCQLMEEALDVVERHIQHLEQKPVQEHPEGLRRIAQLMATQPELERERYIDLVVKGKLAKRSIMNKAIKQAQRELASQEERSPEEALRWQIEDIRTSQLKGFQIKKQTSDLIIDDMKQRGAFYETEFSDHYWFDNEVRRLHEIGSKMLGIHLNNQYHLNPTESEHKFLIEQLRKESAVNGMNTQVYRFAHYDQKQDVLYVDNNANQMFRLDGEHIELVDNGTDGVLFLKDVWSQPFQYQPGQHGLIDSLIIEPIPFASGPGVNLSQNEQQVVYRVWFYSLFFEEPQPTKLIQCLIGPKGSGKSCSQRAVGRCLYGKHFNVTPITKPDAFIATVCEHAFVAFDNVDGMIPWLPDKLAQVATGQRIALRELYTTNEEASFFPRCFISLNAREPKFGRDDVVDRLLIFRLDRLKSWRPESEILAEIEANRDALWSELLDDLNDIVACLREDKEVLDSPFRMADWAQLGWRIAKVRGDGDDFLQLLKKMDRNRTDFLFEGDPLFECLELWLGDAKNLNREVGSRELLVELRQVAQEQEIDFPYRNAKSLGNQLRQILANLREYFDVEERKDRNRWVYRFQLKLTAN